MTVTLHGPKVGNVVGPGRFHGGELVVRDIGLEPRQTRHSLVTREILELVPRKQPGTRSTAPRARGRRRTGSHRGSAAGGGSRVPRGRGLRRRGGAGSRCPCSGRRSWPSSGRWRRSSTQVKAGAVAIGPGLGRDEARPELVRRLLMETELPAVVDADGLHGLERVRAWRSDGAHATRRRARRTARRRGCGWTRTGWRPSDDSSSSAASASSRAPTRSWPPPRGRARLRSGPATLATAGTGDVLTGTILQLSSPRAWMHAWPLPPAQRARAARLGPERGLVASDVIAACPTRSMSFEHAL